MLFSLAMSLEFVVGPKILFVGNSHTQNGDVPGVVQKLIAGAECQYFSVGLLNQWKSNSKLVKSVQAVKYNIAVLQGAEVSSSHKYSYSQGDGVELAKQLVKGGTKVYLVSEWPRRDWDEADYTEAVYRAMAKESGAQVIPVGRVWDGVRKRMGGIDLWQHDGNHANAMGSYLSARVIARWIGGEKLSYVPVGFSPKFVEAIDAAYLDVKK
jgi:hypothetical protein